MPNLCASVGSSRSPQKSAQCDFGLSTPALLPGLPQVGHPFPVAEPAVGGKAKNTESTAKTPPNNSFRGRMTFIEPPLIDCSIVPVAADRTQPNG